MHNSSESQCSIETCVIHSKIDKLTHLVTFHLSQTIKHSPTSPPGLEQALHGPARRCERNNHPASRCNSSSNRLKIPLPHRHKLRLVQILSGSRDRVHRSQTVRMISHRWRETARAATVSPRHGGHHSCPMQALVPKMECLLHPINL